MNHFLLNSVDPLSVENLILDNRMCQSSRSEGLIDKGTNDWFGKLKNHVRSTAQVVGNEPDRPTAQVVGNEPDRPTTRHEESPLEIVDPLNHTIFTMPLPMSSFSWAETSLIYQKARNYRTKETGVRRVLVQITRDSTTRLWNTIVPSSQTNGLFVYDNVAPCIESVSLIHLEE